MKCFALHKTYIDVGLVVALALFMRAFPTFIADLFKFGLLSLNSLSARTRNSKN